MNRRACGLLLALTIPFCIPSTRGDDPPVKDRSEDISVSALVKQLKSPNNSVARGAAFKLRELGKKAKSAVPALLAIMKDKKRPATVRAAVAEALPFIGADAKTASPILTAGLKDEHTQLRCRCAFALARIDPKKTAAAVAVLTKTLEAAVEREDAISTMLAAQALGNIGPKAKSAVGALQEAIRAGGRGAYYARKALKEIDPETAKKPLPPAKKKKKDKVAFDAKKLVGSWVIPAPKPGAPTGTVTFAKDGKVTFAFKGKNKGKVVEMKVTGTWKLDGKKLRMTLKHERGESKQVFIINKLTDTELTTEEEDGKLLTLKKQGKKKE